VHLALDVHYEERRAVGACVAFERAADEAPAFVIVEVFPEPPAAYEPGNFRKRELPVLLRLVEAARKRGLVIDSILVDGYVWLGEAKPGLGWHLHAALGVPVVGVAKTRFKSAPAVEVCRGRSASPLFVTAVGVSPEEAAAFVRAMHGPFRIPTLLRRVDRAARDAHS
jgi:deoxyribonuclease V